MNEGEIMNTNNEDKTVAIVAYLTLIGWFVALILSSNSNKKSELGSFHLRQALGLFILGSGAYLCTSILAVIPIINLITLLLLPVIGIGMFVFWVMGLISAINGQMKPLPLFGEKAQELLKGIN